MTEIDWLSGDDAAAMLAHVDGHASERKLRLFACACVRRYWRRLDVDRRPFLLHADDEDDQPTPPPRPIGWRAVELAEEYAEGRATLEQVNGLRQEAENVAMMLATEFDRYVFLAAAATLSEHAGDAARLVCENLRIQAVREGLEEAAFGRDEQRIALQSSLLENRGQAAVLHEMFGNPFRPSVIDPNWLAFADGAVANVARLIQDERRFEELPYLADALLDAGCTDEFLLRHLREPASSHTRGCWALEALLAEPT